MREVVFAALLLLLVGGPLFEIGRFLVRRVRENGILRGLFVGPLTTGCFLFGGYLCFLAADNYMGRNDLRERTVASMESDRELRAAATRRAYTRPPERRKPERRAASGFGGGNPMCDGDFRARSAVEFKHRDFTGGRWVTMAEFVRSQRLGAGNEAIEMMAANAISDTVRAMAPGGGVLEGSAVCLFVASVTG